MGRCTPCTGEGVCCTAVVRTMHGYGSLRHSKYKTMEMHLLENRKRIQMKLPDLEKSLEVVKMLQEKQVSAGVVS